jgi:hypothetical protein
MTKWFALALVALFLFVAPANASPVQPVGQRINVFSGSPQTFPAGAPFHINHGWALGVTAHPEENGLFGFSLAVDGVQRDADGVLRSTDPAPVTSYDYPELNRSWVFDFPDGMTGTHTFTGSWTAPCDIAVSQLGYPGPCNSKTARVVVLTRSVTVTFVRTDLALGKSVTASGEYPGNPASFAVDGNWWSYWSSGGFPPQWIEIDLGAVQSIGEVDLGITQLPDCTTDHLLYGRASTSDPYTLLKEFNGYTVDQQNLTYVATSPQQLRYIRVETTSSCSWVGWREIAIYGP